MATRCVSCAPLWNSRSSSGSAVEDCGPFPPAAFPPRISASKCWVAKGDEGPSPHLVNEGSVRQGEAGRSDTTGQFLPFPKVLQFLGKAWFRLCNLRHKHVVTIRRKPGGLICWWRSLVNTGMNSQDGILMFYLYMQIRIDMKMGRKKSQKYNQCLSHYPFGSVLLQSSLFARSVLFWLSSNLLFPSLASKQADVILFRQQTQR